MEPVFELALDLPPPRSRRRARALHQQLRAAIIDGRLQQGLKLPPTRALAAKLNVSRNAVVTAYELLLSEGYLSTRRGAGTYVAGIRLPAANRPRTDAAVRATQTLHPFWRDAAAGLDESRPPPFRFDFRLGAPDTVHFPFEVWRRLAARVMRSAARSPTADVEPRGRATLRAAVAAHMSFTRALACHADDVIITSGAQQAFDLLARILVTPRRNVVAVEDPGYPPLRTAFAAAGARLVPVPVDREGLVVERLPSDAHVVCVTPSHQFPLGSVMSLRRRAELLQFALARQAIVVEDDYDAEFRFDGRPHEALLALDREQRVFYVGTFEKSLLRGTRLGFVIAPPWARPVLAAAKRFTDMQSPVHAQDTLAAFISEGHMARHVRKARHVYAKRRQTLLGALQANFEGLLSPIDSPAGLHVTALTRSVAAARELVRAGIAHRTRVYSLDQFALGAVKQSGVVFGFGAIDAAAIEEGLRHLKRSLDLRRRPRRQRRS